HILTELGEMSTCIGIIERGKLLYAGSIKDAFARTRAASASGERIVVRLEPEGAAAAQVKAALQTDSRIARVEEDGSGNALTLNPANIPGPIFQKEVWISGRKAGTYWARALYTAGMLGFVTLVFTSANFGRFMATPAQRLQASQDIAPAIFTTVISFQFLALAL